MRHVILALALTCAMAAFPGPADSQVVAGGGRSGGGPAPATAINGPSAILPPMPAGDSAISGAVTDGVTGRPLSNAVVVLSMQAVDSNGAPRRVSTQQQTTDSKGRFVFVDLAAGAFTLTATHFAYFDGGYGRRPDVDAASAPRLVVADRQWLSRTDIQLWHTGAIAGTVTDEHGEPVVGAFVRAMRQFVVGGSKQLAAGPVTTTDDRGQYRIYGLDPGTYLINVPSVQASVPAATPVASAEPALDRDGVTRRVIGRYPTPPSSSQGSVVYASAFHPSGGAVGQAEAVAVDYGSNPSDVDVRLTPVRAFLVSGRVDGPLDVASKLTLRLMAEGAEDLSLGGESATSLVAADGSFAFMDVPAGDYVLEARGSMTEFLSNSSFAQPRIPTPPGWTSSSSTSMSIASGPPNLGLHVTGSPAGERYWSRMPLHVASRDLTNVVVALHPAVSLSGRLVFEGSAEPPSFVVANAESADARPSLGLLQNRLSPSQSPNAFQIDGLQGADYFLRLRPSPPWVVKSIMSGGHDYAAQPFNAAAGHDFTDIVVTFTDKGGTVAGSVRASAAASVDSAAVILFPADRAGWTHYGFSPDRIKTTVVGTGGGFQFANMPAGNYLVVAVDRSRIRAWQDPAFLEAAARQATAVTVDWGQTRSVELSLVTIR